MFASNRKPTGLRTFVWYVSPFQRFLAQGAHQQAAFDTLPQHYRNASTYAEFCVEVPSRKDLNRPYLELEAMSRRATAVPARSSRS